MRIRLVALGLIAAAGLGAWFLAGSASGDYYAMSPQEAASRLVTAHMPGEVTDTMSGSGDLVHRVYKRGVGEVVWEFSVARTSIAIFTAALEPEGEGTRVSVDLAIAENELGEAAREDLGEGQEFLTGALEVAMNEHIAATLERRKFDEDDFGREIAKHALSNPTAAHKFLRQMQTMKQDRGTSATEIAVRKRVIDEAAWNGEIDEDAPDEFEDENSGFASQEL